MTSTSFEQPEWFLENLMIKIKLPDESLDKLTALSNLCHATELCHVTEEKREKEEKKAAVIWREILLAIPSDSRSFRDQYGSTNLTDVVVALQHWHAHFQKQDPLRHRHKHLFGFLGVVLLTLVAVCESERHRYRGSGDGGSDRPSPSNGYERVCSTLFQDCAETDPSPDHRPRLLPAIQSVLQIIYSPPEPPPEPLDCAVLSERQDSDAEMRKAWKAWENVDFSTLEFHRYGTTSIIFHCDRKNGPPTALKLIVYPFLRIRAIKEATERYSRRHDIVRVPIEEKDHLVEVDGSTENWVLMEFINGYTVAEELHKISVADRLDLVRMEDMGRALFDALVQLERLNREGAHIPATHADLSPSNIIVQYRDGERHFVLIDQGRNYLYSHSITGRSEGGDARYVAPEIIADSDDESRADVYSVGRLLVTMAGLDLRSDGTVPDVLYNRVPFLARFLEDLVDQDPRKRLLIYGLAPDESGRLLWDALRNSFAHEVKAVIKAEGPAREGWRSQLREIASPSGGAPGRQLRLLKVVSQIRKKESEEESQKSSKGQSQKSIDSDSRRIPDLKRLLLWSGLSTSLFSLSFLLVSWCLLRDAGWSWGNPLVELVQRIAQDRFTGRISDVVPFLDSLRRPGYNVPDLDHNWLARIVGLSYLLACVKYYQNILSGVNPLAVGSGNGMLTWRARAAEAGMRLMLFTAPVLVLVANLIDVRWWPIASAIGQTVVLFTNWTCVMFVDECLSKARKLEMGTVSTDDTMTGLKQYQQWIPGALFYAVIVWGIGFLIVTGHLGDEWLYASGVTATNLLMFYVIKCGISAPGIRITLHRAVLAGERVDYLNQRQASGTS